MISKYKNFLKEVQWEVETGRNNKSGQNSKKVLKFILPKVLDNLGDKKLWRCNVCNDLQISLNPLQECPTCFTKNAYVEIG